MFFDVGLATFLVDGFKHAFIFNPVAGMVKPLGETS